MSQQPGAEPQYSPDGKWWWNGYQWVPVPATPPRLLHKQVGFRLAVVSVLVLVAACGGLALLASHASGSPSAAVTGFDPEAPNVSSAPTDRPQATEAPTPTAASQSQQAVAYVRAVQIDSAAEGSTAGALGVECGSGQASRCRAAFVALQNSTSAFQHDLDANPAPPCLAGPDARLRAGLALESQASQLGIQGIDQIDASKVNQAATVMDQANTDFTQTATLIRQAQC